MGSKIILFFLGLLVWLGLSLPLAGEDFFIGIIVAVLVAMLTGDLFIKRIHLFKHPRRYFWFFYYLPLFLWECLKANVDVAFRVSHPKLPINPGLVKVKTRLKTDVALTFLANSITLTPGTMSVDVDKENGELYVHWIYVKDKRIEEATRLIIKKFEQILERIFE